MTVREPRLYSSFEAAVAGILEMMDDGWNVDIHDNPPTMVGFAYEVSYIRATPAPVKKTRAEILADARAAKAAKKDSA